MTAKAECTWGEGPDVLIVLSGVHTAGAHLPAGHLHQTYSTLVRHPDGKWSFGLTAPEAKSLAAELLVEVARVERFEAAAPHSKPKLGRREIPQHPDPRCPCGWRIPVSIMPCPTELLSTGTMSRDKVLRDVSFRMHCPECGECLDLVLDIRDSELDE